MGILIVIYIQSRPGGKAKHGPFDENGNRKPQKCRSKRRFDLSVILDESGNIMKTTNNSVIGGGK